MREFELQSQEKGGYPLIVVRYEDIKKNVSTEVQFMHVYIFATCSDYIIAL